MLDDHLSRIFTDQLTVLVVTAVLLLALAEAGFRLGVRLDDERDKARKIQIGGIQGAVLGMLGLLLGFTFGMALDRYEERRGLVVQEANAVGTTYLRALLLPDAHQVPVKYLLRRYVGVWVKYEPLVDDQALRARGFAPDR